MIKHIFFYIVFLFAGTALAQQDSTKSKVFFEPAPEGLVRFYFDNYYYLVDKNCQFKSIERVSQFIVAKNVFHGEFKDFALNGKIVLTGFYNEGVKEGIFTAYHPNGEKKWEVMFENDRPTGTWNYYYPDGKPMFVVNYGNMGVKITTVWDQVGIKRVEEGNGNYEFKMPYVFYNEYGFPFFERKGKLKDGVPTGYWTTHVVDEKNRKTLLAEEIYSKGGFLTEAYNLFLDEEYTQPMSILPTEYFTTAETLNFKECSFDDYSGFYTYLSDKFNSILTSVSGIEPFEDDFTVQIALSSKGYPKKATAVKALKPAELNKAVESVLLEIPYYFPSLDVSGTPIDDTLNISGKIIVDKEGKMQFHSFRIKREMHAE